VSKIAGTGLLIRHADKPLNRIAMTAARNGDLRSGEEGILVAVYSSPMTKPVTRNAAMSWE